MSRTNRAAWLKEAKADKLIIEDAPFPTAKSDEVIVKVDAVAINPVDWALMDHASFLVKSYPTITGADISGTVIEAGQDITQVQAGDKVIGSAMGAFSGEPKYGAFQEYAVLKLPIMSKVPDGISSEQAAVLPLGVKTAAAALFQKECMALPMPPSSAGMGRTVLVWGGSSSVGACAIQLAVAVGYEVVTTASKRNHAFCLSLGASRVLDYHDGDIVEQLRAELQGRDLAGAMTAVFGEDVHSALCEVLAKTDGTKILASVLPGAEKSSTDEVTIKSVFASTIASNEVGPQIFGKFLTGALEDGSFKCKPDPVVVGHGLESINTALDMQKEGVSAQKIVVTL